MLSIRPCQRCTNPAVKQAHEAGQTNQVDAVLVQRADCKTASKAERSLPKDLLSMAAVGTPLSLAFSRAAGIGAVGNHQSDLGREIFFPWRP